MAAKPSKQAMITTSDQVKSTPAENHTTLAMLTNTNVNLAAYLGWASLRAAEHEHKNTEILKGASRRVGKVIPEPLKFSDNDTARPLNNLLLGTRCTSDETRTY